jgi:hypothetical protein
VSENALPAAAPVPPEQALANFLGRPTLEQKERLEAAMLRMPQVAIPVRHFFAAGLYAREIVIPAGVTATGKVHREEHVSIMVSGDMTIDTEEGVRRVSGYNVFIAAPGTKRVGYAHEATVWITVHRNPDELRDETDIEAMLVEAWPPVSVLTKLNEIQSLEGAP